jgi:hypothetical protein
MGLIPNSEDLQSYQIDCTVASVVPTSDLNLLAIDNLTISGSLLPWDLQKSEVDIAFTDTATTRCIPQTSSTGELVCLTQPFDIAEAG